MTPPVPTQRIYQTEATNSLCVQFFDHGLNRLLIKKPTGTGKTVWFASLLRDPRLTAWRESVGPKKGAQMLVIAHREELLDQAAEKIQIQNRGLVVDIEQGSRHASPYADVVIASIQTLAAVDFRRLKRLLLRHTFRIVVVDEAHHAAAATYRTALALLGFLPLSVSSDKGNTEAASFDDVALMKEALEGWDATAPKDRLLIGVTATPNRTDAIGLGCVFQSIAFSYGLKQAIEDGWLTPIKPWVIETAESLDEVHTKAGDFNQKELAAAVNVERRNLLGFESWKLYAGDRPTIAFTVDVAHAYNVANLWQRAGIRAAAISGETPKDERRQILRDFMSGRIQFLANCMVLTEGTDLPLTSCILHLKPTKSATLYEQMTGRGLRPLPGDPVGPERVKAIAAGREFAKPDCVVIDLVDVARRHSLQAAPVLYGLPPGIKTKGDDLRKTATDLEAIRESLPNVDELLETGRFSIQELLDRASTFNVWDVPSMGAFAELVTLNWIPIGGDRFRVSYPWADGNEVLEVSPDLLGHFAVTCTHRAAGSGDLKQRTIAQEVPTAGQALQLAEQFVANERRSVAKLKDKGARWREAPASEAQIRTLRRFGVPFNEKELLGKGGKGRASDLLDLAMSRKAQGGRGGASRGGWRR